MVVFPIFRMKRRMRATDDMAYTSASVHPISVCQRSGVLGTVTPNKGSVGMARTRIEACRVHREFFFEQEDFSGTPSSSSAHRHSV